MDWKLIMMICQVLIVIINIGIFAIIKFNDLKHLSKDVQETKQGVSKKLDSIFRRLGKIEKDIVKREALCNERHSKR